MADKYPNITVPPKTNFGNIVAQCGPKKSGQTHYIVIGIAMVVMAILSFIAPATFIPPQPGHEKMLWAIAIGAGCLFSLLAGVLLLIPMFDKPQVVFGFENGLVERRGDQDRLILFSDIKRAQIFENYEHRFAPQTFNVRLDIQGQKTIFFSSALSGDSMDVIEHLRSQVSCKEVPFTP